MRVLQTSKHFTVTSIRDAVTIDLSNDNDNMLYDGAGSLVSGPVESIAHLYDGSTEVSSLAVWSVTADGCTLTSPSTSREIVVSGMSIGRNAAIVTVTATYRGGVYSTVLKIKRIVNQDKYDLLIEPNAIPYNPASFFGANIAIEVWKTTVTGRREKLETINNANGLIYLAYKLGNSAWASTSFTFSVTAAIAAANNNILFEVRKRKDGSTYSATDSSTYDMMDAETVPITKSENGAPGGNSHVVMLYRRSAAALTDNDRPTAQTTYNFAAKTLTPSSAYTGWSQIMPAYEKGKTLWVTAATAYSTTGDAIIAANSWSTPVEMVEDGKDGLNSAPVFLYQRVGAAPSAPQSQLYYKFEDGNLYTDASCTPNYLYNGEWKRSIPATNANHDPCWKTQATAINTQSYDPIRPDEWSDVVKIVEDGAPGTSPYFADISNEMNGIACTAAGVTQAPSGTYQRVSTRVSLWKGSARLDLSNVSCSVTDGTSTQSVGSSYGSGSLNQYFKMSLGTDNPRTVTIDVKNGYTMSAGKVEIIINVTNTAENIQRDLTFVLAASKAGPNGEPAVVYSLVPSVNEIVKKNGGGYVPAGNTYITCGVVKAQGGTPSQASSGYELYYSLNGGGEIPYSATAVRTNAVTTNLVFTLYVPNKSSGTLVDRETIPLVTDGEDGADAITIDADNDMMSVACDNTGHALQSSNPSTIVRMWRGTTPLEITDIERDDASSDTEDIDYEVMDLDTEMPEIHFAIEAGAYVGVPSEETFTVTSADGDERKLVIKINGVRAGAPGETPILHELAPTESAFVFNRNANGSLAVGVGSSTIRVKVTEGNDTNIVSTLYGHSIIYGFENTARANGTLLDLSSERTISVSATQASDHSSVWVELWRDADLQAQGATYIDRESIPILKDGAKGNDGESPIYLDLDNEMGGVACDADGVMTSEQDVSTNVSMWNGSAPMPITSVACSITQRGSTQSIFDNYASSPSAGVAYWAKYSFSNGRLTITLRNATPFSSTIVPYPPGKAVDINVVVTSGIGTGAVQRSSALTIAAVYAGADGEPATIYNLMPSPSSVNVARSADGGYSPRYHTVTCGYTKNVGGSESSVVDATGNIDNTYRIFFRLRSRNGQSWDDTYYWYNHSTYRRYLVKTSGYSNSGLDVLTYDKVEFILYKNTAADFITAENIDSNLIFDRETIPVIADGLNGAGVRYEIRSTVDSLKIPQGATYAELRTTLSFLKIENGVESAYECSYSIFKRTGQTYTHVQSDDTTTSLTINGGNTFRANRTTDAFVVFIYDGQISTNVPSSYLAKKEIIINPTANDGDAATVYSLEPVPSVVNFRTNAAGEFPDSTQHVTCYVKRIVGTTKETLYPDNEGSFDGLYRLYYYDEEGGAWDDAVNLSTYAYRSVPVNSGDAADGLITKIRFALSTAGSRRQVNDGNIFWETEVPVILDGRRGSPGQAGAIGPMLYPMGYYDPAATYEKTSLLTPMVMVDDGVWNSTLECYGHYWYLTADTNVVEGTHYAPTDGSPYWAQANDYGVVITMGLFAKFAKIAAGVVSGDYIFSANGRIGTTEYVNGQTIGDRPAYTRFLGDPAALGGTIQRTSLSGPVQTDRAVLQTVYLAKGTTLNVSITGKTTTSYFYFRIYKKGGDYVTGYAFIYNSERTTTLTHTAIQDGEYTIECYGSSSAVSATFALSWNVTGMFNPNLWLDLLTGAISGARGNFRLDGSGLVEVNGTVRARNLFKTLALSSGGTQQDTVCTVVIAPDGRPERCICVVKNVPESVYDHAFSAGQYLTPDEIDALVDEPGAWEYDYEYFVPCTGPADEVVLVPNTVIGANGYQGCVYLPRCQDYAGKEVIVRHTITYGVATVKQADGAAVFVGSPYLSGYTFSYGSNPENYKSLAAGQTAIFYSTGARWVVLSIW